MKGNRLLAFVVSAILSTPVLAQVAPAGGAVSQTAAVVIPAAELNWMDLDPVGAPGVKVAILWGDLQKGPFGAFLRLPAGFAAPLHTHTHDMRLAIVSGTYIQAQEGKPEFKLGPGSYLLQPGGGYRHTTSCAQGPDCVFFFESAGGFDLYVVGAVAAPGSK